MTGRDLTDTRPVLRGTCTSRLGGIWTVDHPEFGEVGFFTSPYHAARFTHEVDRQREHYLNDADALMAAKGRHR